MEKDNSYYEYYEESDFKDLEDEDCKDITEDEYFIISAMEFLLSNRKDYTTCMSCHNVMLPGKISICPECLEQEIDNYNLIVDEDD
jgi:hypothetical protein